MAKTETNVNTLKINRGTYANIQSNLSSIGENEIIITSDKNVPIPTIQDSGKAILVNASGEYELGTAGGGGADHLYWHGVRMVDTASGTANKYYLSFVILNTSATPLDKNGIQAMLGTTYNDVKLLVISGSVFDSNKTPMWLTSGGTSTTWSLFSVDNTTPGTMATLNINNTSADIGIYDTVNQIF